MTVQYRGIVSNQYVYWNSNQSQPVGVSDIVRVSNIELLKYPDIDSNTIVAWTFNGMSGNIPNLGIAGSIADMTTIESGVIRNVTGSVSAGIAYNGTLANTRVFTASGSNNIGSSNFTSSITLMAFFILNSNPTTGAARRILLKGYDSTWGDAGIFQGACIEFQGTSIYGMLQTAGGYRQIQASFNLEDNFAFGLGFRPHMVAFTYGTDGVSSVGKLYYDGVLVSRINFSQANVVIGNVGDEGPWNVGGLYGNFPGFYDGIDGIMYHARAENTVRSAEWIRQAWNNFNGQ